MGKLIKLEKSEQIIKNPVSYQLLNFGLVEIGLPFVIAMELCRQWHQHPFEQEYFAFFLLSCWWFCSELRRTTAVLNENLVEVSTLVTKSMYPERREEWTIKGMRGTSLVLTNQDQSRTEVIPLNKVNKTFTM